MKQIISNGLKEQVKIIDLLQILREISNTSRQCDNFKTEYHKANHLHFTFMII
jgi:hypothetical protein